MSLSLQEIAAGITAAIRDPSVPIEYSPLLMAALKRLNENEIGRLREASADKDRLIEKLHVIAKNVSHALMSFTPGGSEYFTRVKVDDFEDFYADADACQRRVRERITKAEEGLRDQFRARLVTTGERDNG